MLMLDEVGKATPLTNEEVGGTTASCLSLTTVMIEYRLLVVYFSYLYLHANEGGNL